MWFAAATAPRQVTRMHRETLVHAPLAQAFGFFADAANLERLTPSWLRFSIRTAMPVEMRAGVEIEYRIHLYGVPIHWVSVIDVWEPGVRFIDRQLAGPYLWWRHEHRFEAADEVTIVTDEVEYLPRVPWLTRRFVTRDVERIFEYREAELHRIFPPAAGTLAESRRT
jgi:ligand-binding SRPBCC domain-containing protein